MLEALAAATQFGVQVRQFGGGHGSSSASLGLYGDGFHPISSLKRG
jgi:hypothetical protein